jgi:hypothetical protein
LKKYLHFSRQDKLRDRDAQIEETSKILSEKQESFSRLEQDLSNCRLELVEKEKRINEIPKIEVFDILSFLNNWKKVFCFVYKLLLYGCSNRLTINRMWIRIGKCWPILR